MRLGWTTDIHLNFVKLGLREAFLHEISQASLDGLLISGDISEAEDVTWELERLSGEIELPIYFVLGNHDFYHGSIASVRQSVRQLTDSSTRLRYLTGAIPIMLGNGWAVCGDDGWADGRAGDYFGSPIRMNDFQLIHDFRGLDQRSIWRFLRREGAASAKRLLHQLNQCTGLADRIIVLTHIPPFVETCWYDNHHADSQWSPFFVNQSLGWALKRFCLRHPNIEIVVLCGHTHSAGNSKIMNNLVVLTGGASYGQPSLTNICTDENWLKWPVNWSFEPSN